MHAPVIVRKPTARFVFDASPRRLRLVSRLAVVACLTALSCAAKSPEPVAPARLARPPGEGRPTVEVKDGPVLIGRIPEGSLGPHRITGDGYDVVVWVSADPKEGGVFARDSKAKATTRLGDAPSGLRFMRVETKEGRASLLLAHSSGQEHFLSASEFDPKTLALGPRSVIVSSPSPILWAEDLFVGGHLLVWAERGAGGADLYARSMNGGKLGQPRRIARGALAWQARAGFGKALVVSFEGEKKKRSLVLRLLGSEGETSGRDKVLSEGISALDELELLVGEKSALVVLTELAKGGSRVISFALDERAEMVSGPTPLTRPRGKQRLERALTSPDGKRFLVGWEEPSHDENEARHLFLSLVDGAGRAHGAIGRLETRDASNVELALDDDGSLRFLASGGSAEMPRFFVGSASFSEKTSSMTELALPSGSLGLAWDLGGTKGEPKGLLATLEPAPLVYAFSGVDRVNAGASPFEFVEAQTLPFVKMELMLENVPELSRLVAFENATGIALSWLSYFDPSVPPSVKEPKAPDGKAAPMRAWVKSGILARDESGELTKKDETIVSYRARSLGGLAVLPKETGHLLGWSAIDGNDPGLFVTELDVRGKKKDQKMLFKGPGEITDICLARASTGALVVWVDGSGGSPRILGLRIDEKLRPIGKEFVILEGLRDPTDLTLVESDRGFLLALAERTESAEGAADLFVLSLDERGERTLAPRRLFPTPTHSFSPHFVRGEKGANSLVWLEAAANSEEASRVLVVNVEADGRPLHDPKALVLEGNVRSFAVERAANSLHAVFLVERAGRGELWGGTLEDLAHARKLTALEGAPSQTVAPTIAGNYVFFVDQTPGGSKVSALELEF